MTDTFLPDKGSFHDPSGQIYRYGNRIFRTVMPTAASDFEYVRNTGLIAKMINQGLLWPEQIIDKQLINLGDNQASYVLEHPPLPFISYPYEWSFTGLKAAALLHLEIHLQALDHGVTLTDASAYNIQFLGTRPIFIDHLSFRRYQEGEFWLGYRQFCEQFLNPLLLQAFVGITHNAWYRSNLEGITASDLQQVLPLKRKLSFKVFTHVILQARLQKISNKETVEALPQLKLPLKTLKKILSDLHDWISKLQPAQHAKTIWSNYLQKNSYSADQAQIKEAAVREFIKRVKPKLIWDLGCNTGHYSKIALEAGVEFAVGFETDSNTLELGFTQAQQQQLNFLPLFIDAANPSPNQGFSEMERQGLLQRSHNVDALLALALIHHLAIARNIPLDHLAEWLIQLAPHGLIEFVGKEDPMVKELLRLRSDIFSGYNLEYFLNCLSKCAEIIKIIPIPDSHRNLIWYKRK